MGKARSALRAAAVAAAASFGSVIVKRPPLSKHEIHRQRYQRMYARGRPPTTGRKRTETRHTLGHKYGKPFDIRFLNEWWKKFPILNLKGEPYGR